MDSKKILVVDDDVNIANYCGFILKKTDSM